MKAHPIYTTSAPPNRYYAAQSMLDTVTGILYRPAGYGSTEAEALAALADRKELSYADCIPASPLSLFVCEAIK